MNWFLPSAPFSSSMEIFTRICDPVAYSYFAMSIGPSCVIPHALLSAELHPMFFPIIRTSRIGLLLLVLVRFSAALSHSSFSLSFSWVAAVAMLWYWRLLLCWHFLVLGVALVVLLLPSHCPYSVVLSFPLLFELLALLIQLLGLC